MDEIVQLKGGDLTVFNNVYEAFHGRLYHYVLGKTGSLFQAEEITQLTFIKLWNSRQNLNEDIPLDTQIFRIARTTMIDQLRHVSGYEKMQTLLTGKSKNEADCNAGPDSLQEKEIREKLQRVLSKLPPMQKKVFELSRLYHLNHKEIASLQSIRLKTVENHMNQALRKIREAFLLLAVFLLY